MLKRISICLALAMTTTGCNTLLCLMGDSHCQKDEEKPAQNASEQLQNARIEAEAAAEQIRVQIENERRQAELEAELQRREAELEKLHAELAAKERALAETEREKREQQLAEAQAQLEAKHKEQQQQLANKSGKSGSASNSSNKKRGADAQKNKGSRPQDTNFTWPGDSASTQRPSKPQNRSAQMVKDVLKKGANDCYWKCFVPKLNYKRMEGRLPFRLRIDDQGHVQNLSVQNATLKDAEVEQCCTQIFSQLEFGPGPATHATYPVVLVP